MRRFILLLTSVFLLYSCNKDVAPEEECIKCIEENSDVEESLSYIGRWKLMSASFYSFLIFQDFGELPPELDYSNHNVIYEFREDSILVVSGKMDHPNMSWYVERRLDSFFKYLIWEGTHLYSAIESIDSPLKSPLGTEWQFSVEGYGRYTQRVFSSSFPLTAHLGTTSMYIGALGWGTLDFVRERKQCEH